MYRETCMDPDYHRAPKTQWFCTRCQKDLKVGQPFRYVASELDVWHMAIHSDDWRTAYDEIAVRRVNSGPAFCVLPIGSDCARKIGLEYSRPAEDFDPSAFGKALDFAPPPKQSN